MASTAVNVNSALIYIANKIGISVDIVRSWFPNENANRSKILNIRSAFNILQKMMQIGFAENISMPTSANTSIACSSNTFKALYEFVMSGKAWNIKTTINTLRYGHYYVALTPTSMSGAARGGSGGGSGATYGADTFDVTSGNGANGGASRIYKNGVEILNVAGGAGGAGVQVTGGKNPGALNGNAGSIGNTTSYSISTVAGDKFGFFPGYGGGGSAGVRSPNTHVGLSASYASGSNANNDGGATNASTQGGGGGGGSGYDGTNKIYTARGADFTYGSMKMNYASEAGMSVINGTFGMIAEGGRGGDQADTTSSAAGVYKSESQRCGGGNGGSSGYFTIDSITTGFIFNDLGEV